MNHCLKCSAVTFYPSGICGKCDPARRTDVKFGKKRKNKGFRPVSQPVNGSATLDSAVDRSTWK